jgi:hypothetical protein
LFYGSGSCAIVFVLICLRISRAVLTWWKISKVFKIKTALVNSLQQTSQFRSRAILITHAN